MMGIVHQSTGDFMNLKVYQMVIQRCFTAFRKNESLNIHMGIITIDVVVIATPNLMEKSLKKEGFQPREAGISPKRNKPNIFWLVVWNIFYFPIYWE